MSTTTDNFAAFIGLDWADKKHDVCLRPGDGAGMERTVVRHEPAALDEWASKLRERFGGRPVAICLELSRGPIVSALLKHDFFVIFPINPSTLAKYREAFVPSHAKDDPSDAELALDLVMRHPERFRPLRPQSAGMRALQQLVQHRRSLVGDATRIINRLVAALKAYYPQVLDWFDRRNTAVFCDFLIRWSSLQAVKKARRSTVEKFFHEHHVRRRDVIERRLEGIKTAVALTTDAGVVVPARLLVERLAPHLRLLLADIERFDEVIAQHCAEHEDYPLFAGLPAAGPAFAPRLLAALGEDRERFCSAEALQRYSGIAPVTERSGNKEWVHWRQRAPKFLRQTFVEWVGLSVMHSFWARAYYDQQRERKRPHNTIIRSLAFKWLRIIYRCWVDRTSYDETKYLLALRKKGSPLLQSLAKNTA